MIDVCPAMNRNGFNQSGSGHLSGRSRALRGNHGVVATGHDLEAM
jgi:ribulose-5-phosphate 4-epimerase/fuculose-1-phosphate aldolase